MGLATSIQNAQLNLITAAIDAGAGAGKLNIYTAPRPAKGAVVGAATLLAELTFSATSFGAAAAGEITANSITGDASANADGTGLWARITDSDDNFVRDISVGATGSGQQLILNSTAVTTGVPVDISDLTMTANDA